VSEIVKPEQFPAALVLDTTHATEGFIRVTKGKAADQSIKSAKKRVRPGDVIISRLRPYLRQVAYLTPRLFHSGDKERVVLCSTEFFVLRGHAHESIAFLAPLLLSRSHQEILSVSQEGGHHPRFTADTLLGLAVDPELAARKDSVSTIVTSLADEARRIEEEFAALLK
jgi:hypothetical protein